MCVYWWDYHRTGVNVPVMPTPKHSPERTGAHEWSGGLKSRAEAADYLSVSVRTIDQLVANGDLAAIGGAKGKRFTVAELERHIADLPAYEPAS
jgi:excisionase family DNA binding protein